MENCEPLTWYGALVLIILGGLIVIPYLRRKGELISAFNILLLGIAIYIGLGCFEAVTSPMRFPGLQWFQPTKDEVSWFMTASTVFIAALVATYFYNPVSRVTIHTFNKWPPETVAMYLTVWSACVAVLVLTSLTTQVFFVGKVLMQMSHKAVVFASVFSFMLWFRNRLNFAWLALFIATFLGAALFSTLIGGTRRLLLSVLAGPVICVYMTYVRQWRPTRGMIAVGITTFAVFTLGLMYNAIRHFNVRGEFKERTAVNVIEEVRHIGERDWLGKFSSDKLRYMSQSNVHYALFTQRSVDSGRLETRYFNTLAFLISWPVPRQIWPEKPRPLGGYIIESVIGWGVTSMGVSIAGHAAYEGGLIVAVLYAFLVAIGLRFIDDPLQRQPANPFLIAVLVSAAPHILAWPRGDLAVMTVETIECIIFVIVLAIVTRALFGTQRQFQSARATIPRANVVYRPVVR